MSHFQRVKVSHIGHDWILQCGWLPRSSLGVLLLHRRIEHARLALAFEPVALALDVDRRRVVQQPVQDRSCQHRIAEDVAPVHEALVGSQDQ